MRPLARYCEGLCPSHSPVWSPRIPLTFWSWISGGAQVCSRWGHDSASWCRAAFLVVPNLTKAPLPAVLTAARHQSSHQQLHPAVHPMVVQGGHQWGHDLPADVGQAFLVMPNSAKAPLPVCPHASFTNLPTNNSPLQTTTFVQLH